MAFKTAIFYDVENLLKGYNFSQQLIMDLSLEEILSALKSSFPLEGLAVQKAYANWSDPRLGVMRSEINSLGIDPIQVFGFSKEAKKNAADIQLAIDVIDLAYTRPAIEIFVIVSGDGGFAALAKKLHEYGKTVIGCAYRHATNNVFRAVCDSFVWIDDPELEADDECGGYQQRTNDYQVTDPRNVRLTQKIQPIMNPTKEQMIEKIREIIAWYSSDKVSRSDLMHTGLFLSVVQEAVKYAIPGFQQSKLGFPKFVECMQHICTGTVLNVSRPPGSGAVLSLRGNPKPTWDVLPDIEARDPHSIENYRSILTSGSPIFRLPDKAIIIPIAEWICHNGRNNDNLDKLIEKASTALPEYPVEYIKYTLLSFVSADIFVKEPDAGPILEQNLRLRKELTDAGLILSQIMLSVEQKLKQSVGDFHSHILDEIISVNVQPAALKLELEPVQ